jgi:hypothetical protein
VSEKKEIKICCGECPKKKLLADFLDADDGLQKGAID